MKMFEYSDSCDLCPKQCGVNRKIGERGYCNCTDQLLISNIFLHKGEEPIISGSNGICNVFFAHCNLRCIYCQNYQISRNDAIENNWIISYEVAVDNIIKILDDDIQLLGFVSPSHQVPQMVEIIERVRQKGLNPTIVYNSNGYESVETLKKLEDLIDVYLPDFKYYDNKIGELYSGVHDYFDFASLAIKEMYRQKGSTIILDDKGLVESGLIIRHLVLPNHSDDSIKVLEYIADEISSNIHVSLMSQYYPTGNVSEIPALSRVVSTKEYEKVVKKVDELGFRGWVQELSSSMFYQPDFSNNSPFKE